MKTETRNYSILFGSNLYHNLIYGVVLIDGESRKDQLFRIREGKDGKVFCDCTVKDAAGTTIVKIVNSKIKFLADNLTVTEDAKGHTVIDSATQEKILEYAQMGPRQWKINGIFHYPDFDMEIRADDEKTEIWSNEILRMTVSGFIAISSATGIHISENGIRLG